MHYKSEESEKLCRYGKNKDEVTFREEKNYILM
jgi:hypothetical protein